MYLGTYIASKQLGARELGLSLNHEESEIIYHSSSVLGHLQSAFSIMEYVHPNDASLLGSPIGDLYLLIGPSWRGWKS